MTVTPELRAARLARMRDTMPTLMNDFQRKFLSDFETKNGRVTYRMEVVGVNSGTYIKFNKGQDIMGAVYVDTKQLPKTPYRAYAD